MTFYIIRDKKPFLPDQIWYRDGTATYMVTIDGTAIYILSGGGCDGFPRGLSFHVAIDPVDEVSQTFIDPSDRGQFDLDNTGYETTHS